MMMMKNMSRRITNTMFYVLTQAALTVKPIENAHQANTFTLQSEQQFI